MPEELRQHSKRRLGDHIKIADLLYKNEIRIGIVLYIISIILFISFIESRGLKLVLPILIMWFATAFSIDFLDRKVIRRSFFPRNAKSDSRFLRIAIASIVFSFALEIFGMFLTRLWYYPIPLPLEYKAFTMPFYFIVGPFAFIAYGFVLFSLYEIINKIVQRKRKYDHRLSKKEFSKYSILMKAFFIAGIIGLAYSLYYSSSIIYLSDISIFEIEKSTGIQIDWWYGFVLAFSLFSIFEYISFRQKKITLTLDIMKGNMYPLLSILIANLIGIAIFELTNTPLNLWIFDNWPLNDVKIFNLPILSIAYWLLQFPVLLAITRSMFTQREVKIW